MSLERIGGPGRAALRFLALALDTSLRFGADLRWAGYALPILPLLTWGAVAAEKPEPLVASPGTAVVRIIGDGGELQVELLAPAISLLGFEHDPRTSDERKTLRLAEENLRAGEALVRFSTRAACRLEHAEVDRGSGGKADRPRELSARYRFACDQPGLLDSAAVGLFVAFPLLERLFLRYEVAGVRGVAELNRGRPVASFVPLY